MADGPPLASGITAARPQLLSSSPTKAEERTAQSESGAVDRPRQSFRSRITAAILLTAVAVLFFGCVLFMVEQQRLDRDSAASMEKHLASFLASAESDAMVRGDRAHAERTLTTMATSPLVRSAEILDARGAIFARYPQSGTLEGMGLGARAPVMLDGRRIGQVVLRRRAPAMALLLPRYVAMGGALFFAAMALALFLGRWLAGRITEPVSRLIEMMGQVGRDGDFARRLEPSADDELGALTQTFNSLLTTLNGNDKALRRSMSELVTARDAAHAANVQKSQFLANMSHEIRTPLNGVLAMAQILTRGNLEPHQREQVDVIHSSGEALLTILNDILDVSKIEAGKFELEVADFDLDQVVAAVHAGFAAVAEHKRLDFSARVEAGAGGMRRGDATRLRQILNNLVSNALKFTERGGVSLAVGGEGAAGDDGLHITVTDTGMGIALEQQSLLFKKFSQLDPSTTRRFGGTGLGLAICHELAELMGGRVWVESAIDQGSTFHVLLPLARADAPMAVASGEPLSLHAPDGGGVGPASESQAQSDDDPLGSAEGALRVLAAEDNPTNQLVLTTVVQIFGFDLVVVNNGREALEAWERETFDVILMDIQMPVMDGVAATMAIRAAEAATGRARTPIIALSANALVHQVTEYLAAGMDSHVAKPIEIAKLQMALDDVLTVADAASQAA